jgi:hypothetical protein
MPAAFFALGLRAAGAGFYRLGTSSYRSHRPTQFLRPRNPTATPGFFALQSIRRNFAADISSSSFLKEIMTNYKEHCSQYLSNRLRGSSDWRRAQGTKFPEDRRNDKASERLLELESSIDIPDTVWNQIAPFYNECDSRWLAAVSDTNRDIGFRRHPRDFAAYLENLVSNLTRH